jgi:antirestriction protein ArdC
MKFYGKAEATANQIVEQFQSGKLPQALAPIFLNCGGRHADGYSWANQLIVALRGYSDAMTYGKDKKKVGNKWVDLPPAERTGWLSVGRQVRKGEKSFTILAPCKGKMKVKGDDGETEERPVIYGFRGVAVFGLEQTDIVDPELWEKHRPDNAATQQFLDALPLRDVAEQWGLKLSTYSGRDGGAHGWYSGGRSAIALGVENVSTFAHELVHAADDRMGTMKHGGRRSKEYADGEVVAELGGAVLLYALGYKRDADLGGAFKYITAWAQGRDPVQACMQMLNRTCNAVALILETAGLREKTEETEEKNLTPTEA